jgi:hypothetical protein
MAPNANDVFRAYADRSARVFTVVRSQPSWVTRVAFGASLLVMLAIIFLLIVPAFVIGLLVFAVALGVASVRRRIAGLWRPNGALDGRRNVRVIEHRSR